MALEAARQIAEKEGLRGLKARRIAREIGYTIGTLYNLFEDLDDLIVHLNGRTLDDLYQAFVRVKLDGEPDAATRALAACYIQFTRNHPKLWDILFEHHLPDGRELPEWHGEKIRQLLGLVERALAPLFPAGQEVERHHCAIVLWSRLHGICSLESKDKLIKTESVEAMSDTLISNYLVGLRHRTDHSP